ncbi:MAG: tol-pal system protein YbgF [Cyclobacteriaceae bacterium]
MQLRRLIIGVLLCFQFLCLQAKDGGYAIGVGVLTDPPDSIPLLLLDEQIQIDANQAINDMYNFQFGEADKQFRWLKQKYGWHPLPYFLMGLSQWWRIMPDLDVTRYDDEFRAYMDTALVLSERIYDLGSEVEGAFFMAATYSFIGRLESERRNWRKAAVAGKNALNYLDEIRDNEDFSPELLFGDGLFNYYREWVPENYPILKPMMIFFEKGDKELGIQQLKEVSRNAFFTRTEAQYFLMRILSTEPDGSIESLRISQYLAETYPMNPYFHRYYSRLLYHNGRYRACEKEALLILHRLDSAYTGYEFNSARYATFFLGEIYKNWNKPQKAKEYYQLAVEYGDATGDTERGYTVYSLLSLGRIAENEEDQALAKNYYKEVRKRTSRGDDANKRAREAMKGM